MTVEADVSNTGPLAGDEVAELYLHPPQTAISPRLALSGFERTPGRWGNEASVVPP
jgi:beta-glucosidase